MIREPFLFLLLLSNASLYGCDYLANKGKGILHEGTVKAVENCIANSSSEMVNERITRSLCISENEQPFRGEFYCYNTSVAEYYLKHVPAIFECYGRFQLSYRQLVLKGSLDNDSTELVLTRYTVHLTANDARFMADPKEHRDLWIQPKEFGEFRLNFNVFDQTPAELDQVNGSNWRLRVYDLYGVRIEVED